MKIISVVKKAIIAVFVGYFLIVFVKGLAVNAEFIWAVTKFLLVVVAVAMFFFHKEIIAVVKERYGEFKDELGEISKKDAACSKKMNEDAIQSLMNKAKEPCLNRIENENLSRFITDVCNILGGYNIREAEPVCSNRNELYYAVFSERREAAFRVTTNDGRTVIIGAMAYYENDFSWHAGVVPKDLDMLEKECGLFIKPKQEEPEKANRRSYKRQKKINHKRELSKVRKKATGVIVNGKEYQNAAPDVAAKDWLEKNRPKLSSYKRTSYMGIYMNGNEPKETLVPYEVPSSILPKDKALREAVFALMKKKKIIVDYKQSRNGYVLTPHKNDCFNEKKPPNDNEKGAADAGVV